ncbi:MAG: C2H2-type zinc finger protein [Patescibacteria group bacterium]|nr:C2H2-type zinc finger protein [Patescibacteria group bacterium]
MYYKILTNRFAEWNKGDVADIDAEAARVPLEDGEIEPAKEMAEEMLGENPKAKFICEICGKVCKNNAGLIAHMRSHKPTQR